MAYTDTDTFSKHEKLGSTFTSDDIQIQVNGSDPAWITKSSPTKVSRTGGKTFLMTLSDLDDDEDAGDDGGGDDDTYTTTSDPPFC